MNYKYLETKYIFVLRLILANFKLLYTLLLILYTFKVRSYTFMQTSNRLFNLHIIEFLHCELI